jgi:hypothetical protein
VTLPRAVVQVDLDEIDDSTPATFVDGLVSATVAGRQDLVWDELLSENARTTWSALTESNRDFLRRNQHPKNLKFTDQYKVTREEYFTLPPREIWIRSQSGMEHLWRDTRIKDVFADPLVAGLWQVQIENKHGEVFAVYLTQDREGRWRFERGNVMSVPEK